ncbi:MAG: hypothetical protein RR945_00500 [Erysipelotrichaceae bacterium]
MSLTETDELDFGTIIDFVITFNNIYDSDNQKETKIRKATQQDYDAF